MSQFEPQDCPSPKMHWEGRELNTPQDQCCFQPIVVRVYVPEKFTKSGGIGEDLLRACIAYAGGATVYEAEGAWLAPNDSLIAEDVVVMEVVCFTDAAYDRVHTACMEYVEAAKAAGEQAVLITQQQVKGRIY